MRANAHFEALFDDMARTRHTYEMLRISGGSLDERAQLLTRLQALRAEMASQRHPTL